jgi:NADP-dependent 3-hydroxy acid dehydrogenase YdfG
MSKVFEGKAAIVTGASSGIGRMIAHNLGAAGMELWLVGRSEDQLKETAGFVKDSGGLEPHCVSMDLSKAGELARLVKEVGSVHDHLFALVNNAGVMYPEPILEADFQRWHEMFAINLLTPMEGCQVAVCEMRKHGKPGHLINISSVAAKFDTCGAYGVTKSALSHMGSVLRHELEGDDIRVCTIAPGAFTTNLMRGFPPEIIERQQQKLSEANLDFNDPATAANYFSDPIHIANTVNYILQLPIELNVEELTIRPARNIDL